MKLRVARITASDRASGGIYEDLSGPVLEATLERLLPDCAFDWERRLLLDDRRALADALRDLCDRAACDLVLTTGGTGPAARDLTPEATRDVIDREFPGFGELQRMRTFDIAPTSILTRATAGTRGPTLIVNLPGRPEAVRECLEVLAPALRKAVGILRTDPPPRHAPAP